MIVERTTTIGTSAEELYAWHARAGAFERLVPPWERVRIVGAHPGLIEGARVELEIAAGPGTSRWVARHEGIEPGRGFVDVQESGPFARWVHRHRFEPIDAASATLSDRIEAELPFGPLGELAEPWVRRRLRRTLRYRHAVTGADVGFHAAFRTAPRLTVAITGASGLIGRTLGAMLASGGHQVIRLVRRPARGGEVQWDPAGRLDPAALRGVDAVVHLAGENIAARRWTAARKDLIRTSRIRGTETLVEAIRAASPGPRVLVSASAVGIYGDRGDETLTEDAAPGAGFLAEVGREWEAAARRARDAGVRTAQARFGVVLSPNDGALAKMLLPFRLGLGGPLGNGTQWFSWIGIDDVAGALIHTLLTDSLEGPLNVVAPAPVRNAAFAAALGAVLGRPAVLPVPGAALRLALGDLADEALLASARVLPAALERSGYRFRHPTIDSALRHVLGRPAPG
jgi:uncharacterized protein